MSASICRKASMVPIIKGTVTIVRIMVAMWAGTTPEGSTAETTEDLTVVAHIIESGFFLDPACD
jgi:hypothetical protein